MRIPKKKVCRYEKGTTFVVEGRAEFYLCSLVEKIFSFLLVFICADTQLQICFKMWQLTNIGTTTFIFYDWGKNDTHILWQRSS